MSKFDLEDFQSIVREGVPKFDANSLGLDGNFEECGLDSMDIANVFLLIEERFGVMIPEDNSEDFMTARSVIDFVSQQKKDG